MALRILKSADHNPAAEAMNEKIFVCGTREGAWFDTICERINDQDVIIYDAREGVEDLAWAYVKMKMCKYMVISFGNTPLPESMFWLGASDQRLLIGAGPDCPFVDEIETLAGMIVGGQKDVYSDAEEMGKTLRGWIKPFWKG